MSHGAAEFPTASAAAAAGSELVGLAPADASDPVLETYKKDVDRSLLRENLKLSPQQRSEQLVRFLAAIAELRRAEEARREGRL